MKTKNRLFKAIVAIFFMGTLGANAATWEPPLTIQNTNVASTQSKISCDHMGNAAAAWIEEETFMYLIAHLADFGKLPLIQGLQKEIS